MSIDLIKFGFVSGEISERYFGRTDLEDYDLALALCKNWIVDYRGGISTRPGTQFNDYIWKDHLEVKLFNFHFSSETANTNVLLFGDLYIRFLQGGAYVLEPLKAVTAVAFGVTTVLSVAAHGYTAGQWIKLANLYPWSGETFMVAAPTAGGFEIQTVYGDAIDSTGHAAYAGGAQVARIYTVTSPYVAEDLERLKSYQVRDTMRLTHPAYATRNLIRNDSADWDLELESFTIGMPNPTGVTATVVATGSYATAFVVTAVNEEGEESLPSPHCFVENTVDYSSESGEINLVWNPVAGAKFYNVYRTRIVRAAVSRSYQLGYLGRARGAQFSDSNIIPDFARTPPVEYNPFANGAIRQINVLTGGTGYSNASTINVSDPTGTGFIGRVAVATNTTDDPVVGIIVVRGGKGYTNPTITVTGGSGATFEAEISELEGNYPAVASLFQQRQLYAATDNDPLTVWGSRPGRLSNFGFSDIVFQNDSYEHEIDSEAVSPIRHLVPMRGGLLVFNHSGIWQLTGEGGVVTPTNALAEPQMFKGATLLPPLRVERDLIYAEDKGGTVRLLSYSELAKVYAGEDLSILASHLVSSQKQLRRWCYADQPFKIAWAVRDDGGMLALTILKEQKTRAWSQHWTEGLFYDVINSEEEETLDVVYMVVTRFVNGRTVKYLERFASRLFEDVEDAWSVDCGLALPSTPGIGTLTVPVATGDDIILLSDSPSFIAGDVGSVIRGGGGKMEITEYIDADSVRIRIDRAITALIPETETPLPLTVWTKDAPVMVVGGLRHLEGKMVWALADGNVVPKQQVIDGTIVLPQPATRVIVGLGMVARAKTLPPTLVQRGVAIEGKKKRVVGIALRLHESRGLKVGNEFTKLYEAKERTVEDWGEATLLKTGIKYVGLEPFWYEEAQMLFVQENPLPSTILGYVADFEVEDDT